MDEETYIEWIRQGLGQPGKTRTGLAKSLGIAHPQITQLLKGKRRLKVDEIPRIATYLGTPPPEDHVSIVGYVRAGSEAVLYEDGQGPFDQAPMPPGGTMDTVAVRVQGESMRGRLEDRDLVYYNDRRDPPTPDLLGHLCVVGLQDGRILVKRLLAGSREGLYHLLSTTDDPILDAPVAWAARVIWIRPGN